MGPEHGGSRLGGTESVLDLGVREHFVDLRKQRIGQGRRADGHVADGAEVEPFDELALAHHQRKHRRNPRQHDVQR